MEERVLHLEYGSITFVSWLDSKPVNVLASNCVNYWDWVKRSSSQNGRYVPIFIPRPTIIEVYKT